MRLDSDLQQGELRAVYGEMDNTPQTPPPLESEAILLLNSLLAAEWGLIRALRTLEAETTEEGFRQVFKRLRTDSVANTANLTRLVRGAGGHPTDTPGPLGEQLKALPVFAEKLACFRQAQVQQQTAFVTTAGKILQPAAREALEIFAQLHSENAIWLESVLKR